MYINKYFEEFRYLVKHHETKLTDVRIYIFTTLKYES